MSVAKPATRRKLFAAFGGRCGYCLARPADHLDHLVPRALGGTDSAYNLIPACRPCGVSKAALPVAEWVRHRAAGQVAGSVGAGLVLAAFPAGWAEFAPGAPGAAALPAAAGWAEAQPGAPTPAPLAVAA